MNEFQGKVALVTGAASAIGQGIALLYAKQGARVVVSDIDDLGGKDTVAAITKAGGEATYVYADVSQPQGCMRLVGEALARYDRLDFACNNAGEDSDKSPINNLPFEDWDRTLTMNLSSVFYCMYYEVQAMLKHAGGAIVNMAVRPGPIEFAGAAAQVSSLHGVVGLTEIAAREYSKMGIRVNAVVSSFIKPPLVEAIPAGAEDSQALTAAYSVGPFDQAEELTELVIWLSSDKTSFVTGNYYVAEGGEPTK